MQAPTLRAHISDGTEARERKLGKRSLVGTSGRIRRVSGLSCYRGLYFCGNPTRRINAFGTVNRTAVNDKRYRFIAVGWGMIDRSALKPKRIKRLPRHP